MSETQKHFLYDVMPSALEYEEAEIELSRQFELNDSLEHWEPTAIIAKRKAAQLAVAIDGITDRAALEFDCSKTAFRKEISSCCDINLNRSGANDRIRAVANAYKHYALTDPKLPIKSWKEILVVGAGWGIDGFGIGKFGGVEVLLKIPDSSSETEFVYRKFLGDAPAVVQAIVWFLKERGISCTEVTKVLGVEILPKKSI